MNGNDFLTPLAQTLKTRTRSPCTNTEQESTQISRYSTAELHSKDKGGSQTFQLSSCLQQPWNNTDRQMGQGDGLPSAEGEQPPPATNNWGTCSLTHHICKSHIPRNKDEILLLVSASKFREGHREVIAFVCVRTHKLTPGTVFMAGGSFTRRGESSKHTYPWLWCVTHLPSHSSSRLSALITRAFPPPLHSAAFILPQQQPVRRKGEREEVRKRNKKRKIWGWKSQFGRGIWKDLTCCQAEMKALKIRDGSLTY